MLRGIQEKRWKTDGQEKRWKTDGHEKRWKTDGQEKRWKTDGHEKRSLCIFKSQKICLKEVHSLQNWVFTQPSCSFKGVLYFQYPHPQKVKLYLRWVWKLSKWRLLYGMWAHCFVRRFDCSMLCSVLSFNDMKCTFQFICAVIYVVNHLKITILWTK